MIDNWLEESRAKVNVQQFDLLAVVADRVKTELGLMHTQEPRRTNGNEPMRYLLHGPPGTGKSHVVKLVRELFDIVGYKKGIDWVFMAYQVTNAADLDGDTIHHAIGLKIFGAHLDNTVNPAIAKRMAYWRWVIIDEISLVPVNVLAQVDQQLRRVKPSADPYKHLPGSTDARPFGGCNLLLLGDFKQLPPPQGGYLADMPHRLSVGPSDSTKPPDAMADAGKRLMWEEIKGVVELTERERCKDDWWNEVTDQLRAGRLSENNWKYLHGKSVEGCQLSPEERDSRRRVITGPDDPRLQEARFQEAPIIVANNDSKY